MKRLAACTAFALMVLFVGISEAGNTWVVNGTKWGIRPDNTVQDDFWVAKVDTTDFRKECKTVTYTDSLVKARVTVDSCKWTAVCDTTFEEKIAMKLSKPELDWLLKWLRDAMKPRDRWGYDFGVIPASIIGDTLANYVGNAITWTESAWSTESMDSISVDTLSMDRMK